jgi:hypothetical protein
MVHDYANGQQESESMTGMNSVTQRNIYSVKAVEQADAMMGDCDLGDASAAQGEGHSSAMMGAIDNVANIASRALAQAETMGAANDTEHNMSANQPEAQAQPDSTMGGV